MGSTIGDEYLHMDNFFSHIPDEVLSDECSILFYSPETSEVYGTVKFEARDYITNNRQLFDTILTKTKGVIFEMSTDHLEFSSS